MNNTPNVTINGVKLTFAHTETLRVALESFIMDLQGGAMGGDTQGKQLEDLYITRTKEILSILNLL